MSKLDPPRAPTPCSTPPQASPDERVIEEFLESIRREEQQRQKEWAQAAVIPRTISFDNLNEPQSFHHSLLGVGEPLQSAHVSLNQIMQFHNAIVETHCHPPQILFPSSVAPADENGYNDSSWRYLDVAYGNEIGVNSNIVTNVANEVGNAPQVSFLLCEFPHLYTK